MKMKPKSCLCRQCRRGKSTARGAFIMKYDERSFRRAMKRALKQERYELVVPAQHGQYTD